MGAAKIKQNAHEYTYMRYLIGRKVTLEYANQLSNPRIRSLATKTVNSLQAAIDRLSVDEGLRVYHLHLVLSNTQEELIALFMRTKHGEVLVDSDEVLA